MKRGLVRRARSGVNATMSGAMVLCVLLVMNLIGAPVHSSEPAGSQLLDGFHTLYQTGYPIGPGASYEHYHLRSEDMPLQIHLVRLLGSEELQLGLSLPHGRAQSRESVPEQVSTYSTGDRPVIAAINGDFFMTEPGYSGVSLGLAVKDQEIIRHPRGSAFAILADGQALIGQPEWTGMVRAYDGERFLGEYPLSGINVPRYEDELILFTPAFGTSTSTNPWGQEVVLASPETFGPSGGFSAPILMNFATGNNLIAPDTVILSGHGRAAQFLALPHTPYLRLEVIWSMKDPWHQSLTAVGGGPVLLEDGIILPDGVLGAPLPHQRSPRSAIGIDDQGNLLLVVVDGRQPQLSAGLNLADFARLLHNLGATHALNLDGGGSSTLVVRELGQTNTLVTNSPSDGRARPVGNALMITGPMPDGIAAEIFIAPLMRPVFIGSDVAVDAIALDASAHRTSMPPGPVVWSHADGLGSFFDHVFTAQRAGSGQLRVYAGHLQAHTPITVLGPEDIAKIATHPGEVRIGPGEEIALQVMLYDEEGRDVFVSHHPWSWEVEGLVGSIEHRDPAGHAVFVAGPGEGRGIIHLSLGPHRLSLPVTIGDPPPFLDVAGHWSEGDIRLASDRGWIQGYPDATFRPDHPVSRGEFVKLVVSCLRGVVEPPQEALPFIDEEAVEAWLEPYLASAVELGWVSGFEDGSFRPHQPIQREAATTILMRALGLAEEALDTQLDFYDAEEISAWALLSVVNANRLELLRGFEDNTFRPRADMTRAETVTVLSRSFTVPGAGGVEIATR